MQSSPWRLQLDRSVRFAVSDTLASVKSSISEMDHANQLSPQEKADWNDYLAELRRLHGELLALPNLETAAWLSEDLAVRAPLSTPFFTGLHDAKTQLRRVYGWLNSLPQSASGPEKQRYAEMIEQALIHAQNLLVPGSEAWLNRRRQLEEQRLVSTVA